MRRPIALLATLAVTAMLFLSVGSAAPAAAAPGTWLSRINGYRGRTGSARWATQDTIAEWLVGTGDSNLTVAVYVSGGQLRAGVFQDFALICRAIPTADAATRTYSAKVGPGCFGDVRRPSVAGVFAFQNRAGEGIRPGPRCARGRAPGGRAALMYEYVATVLDVVDGDTVDLSVDAGFNIFMRTGFGSWASTPPNSAPPIRRRDRDRRRSWPACCRSTP